MKASIFRPLINYFHRIQRSRLRQMMRGYRRLKRAGRLGCISAVKQELTTHALNIDTRYFSATVMGAGIFSAELIVRQYLLVRIGGLNLNKALLLAAGNEMGHVVFPLPREWREIVIQHGFRVAHYRSALMWQLYTVTALFYGIAKIGKVTLDGVSISNRNHRNTKSHVYFEDLSSGNLPHETSGKPSYDVISWYLQWQGRRLDSQAIHHNVVNSSIRVVDKIEIMPQRGPLPALVGLGSITKFLIWGLHAFAIAAFNLFCGRWWNALLLNQAAMAAQVRILPAVALAKEYLFHNSGWIYRPLWTYEAEQRQSKISFYFYSTNCESFKRSEGYAPIPYGWKAMNWPRYLVWDEYQADFVRRAVGTGANLSIVGDIWFQSSGTEIPRLPSRSIAVFDVQPVRESFYKTLGLDFEYYTSQTAIQFLVDIQFVLNEQNCVLALKRKREVGKLAHPAYRNYINKLGLDSNFMGVDPNLGASRLIENCIATISMPFTSTALLGRNSGKPSIYYDPQMLLQKDDRAAHGIEILQGRVELRQWVASVLGGNDCKNTAHA